MNIALRLRRPIDTSAIEFRLATVDDVPDVARLFSLFFHDTPWRHFLTYNEGKARDRLAYMIGNGYAPHILAYHLDEPVGVISFHIDKNYTDEGIAVMNETYVMPQYRKSDLGRKLVGRAIKLAANCGCNVFNFPLASGMKQTGTYFNMLRKFFGAQQCGVISCVVLREV